MFAIPMQHIWEKSKGKGRVPNLHCHRRATLYIMAGMSTRDEIEGLIARTAMGDRAAFAVLYQHTSA